MSEEVEKLNEALKSESNSLRKIIEDLTVEKQVLRGTFGQSIEDNLGIKAINVTLQNTVQKLTSDLSVKENMINDLNVKIADLEKKQI